MNIDNLDLNLLRVFDAIYRDQNLSRAAARLGLSQPGVSQALNRLRTLTGDRLFLRQSHGVVPTAYSDALAGPIRQALENLQAALQTQVSNDLQRTRRRIRLVMSDYSESLILAPLARTIADQAPNLQIRVQPVDGLELRNAFQEGVVDMAVGALSSLNDQCRYQTLFMEDFACVVRQNHPTIGETLTLEAFSKAGHVALGARSVQLSKIEQACLSKGFELRPSIIVPNFLVMPYIVASSDCITMLPRRLLRLIPPELNLRVFDPPLEIPPARMCQYWPERLHQDPVCRWLREQIYALCRTL